MSKVTKLNLFPLGGVLSFNGRKRNKAEFFKLFISLAEQNDIECKDTTLLSLDEPKRSRPAIYIATEIEHDQFKELLFKTAELLYSDFDQRKIGDQAHHEITFKLYSGFTRDS